MTEKNAHFTIDGKYSVRMHDRYERQWFDVLVGVTLMEAAKKWDEKTEGGKKHVDYNDADGYHYDIFPVDTKMVYSDDWGAKN